MVSGHGVHFGIGYRVGTGVLIGLFMRSAMGSVMRSVMGSAMVSVMRSLTHHHWQVFLPVRHYNGDEYKLYHWFQKVPFFILLQCKSLLFYTSEIRNYSERLHPPCLAKHRTTTTICRNSASHLFTFFFYTFNRTFASVIVLLDYCVFFFKFRTFFRPPIVFIHIIHISQKYVSTPWFNPHSWVDSWILHLLRAGHADVSADAHQCASMRIIRILCKKIFPFFAHKLPFCSVFPNP